MKNDNGLYGCIGLVVTFVVAMVVGAVLNGWVLSVLWDWFVVPVFQLPHLSIAQAIGVAMVVSFLTFQYSENEQKKRSLAETAIASLFVTLFRAFFTLGAAWVVVQFM